MIPAPEYILSEPHLSGHRVVLGYSSLKDAQDAHQALASPVSPLQVGVAQLHRFKFAADILEGMADGIDGDRLGALVRWALRGDVAPFEDEDLINIFAAPWIAAADEGEFDGDALVEAKNDIERVSADALRAAPVLPDRGWRLNYAHVKGDTLAEMRAAAHHHPIYQLGDAVLVWVNEGDLYQPGVHEVLALPDAPAERG